MYLWVWACTPGRDAQQHVGDGEPVAVQRVEAIELVEAVDDDAPHAGRDRQPQLVDALVVAVHDARRGGHAGGEHDVQLATAGDVEQQPFLVREPGHRPAEERLGGVDHPARPEGGDRLAAAACGCAPRRRRTAACRTAPASSSSEQPPTVNEPSASTVAESGSNRNSIGAMSQRI